MPNVRTMDSSLNTVAKKAAQETALQLLNEFCACLGPRVLGRLEAPFVYSVRAYVEYTLLGEPKHAAEHLREAERLLKKAKELHESTPPSASP